MPIPTPRRLGFAVLLSLPLAVPAQRGDRRELPPPELEHLTFVTDTFRSEALGRSLPYGIYLPKGYDAPENADRRYPLVVWLHGMFEDHRRFHYRGGAPVLDGMVGDGSFPEAVFVTAEGSRNSFYVNGVSSGRWQDAIVDDLLAHLEEEYRVERDRGQRALMGVSMGGFGALKIALRHPQLFGTVAAHSAAVMPRDPAVLDERFPWLERWGGGQRALGQIFGDPIDRAKWDSENLLRIAEQVDAKDLGGLKVYLDCGDADRYGFQGPNQELHELLEERGVKHTWRLVPDGNHGWRSGYNQAALPHSLAFVATSLTQAGGAAGLKGLLAPGKAPGGAGGGDGGR